jgi:hypothetical protein
MPIRNIENISDRLKAQGTNSRKRGTEKTEKALNWVYRWGFSSPTILDRVASPTRGGLTKKLIEQKLLAAWAAPGSGGQKGVPHMVVTLTQAGEALVVSRLKKIEDLLDQNYAQEVQWHQLRHDILVQKATANMTELNGYLTPKEIRKKSQKNVKQPDAIWIMNDGRHVGIELELTPKKRGKEISQTIISLIRSVQPNNVYGLSSVVIYSPSQMILNDYKNHLIEGKKIKIWDKDSSRRWVETSSVITVPALALEKISLREIDL